MIAQQLKLAMLSARRNAESLFMNARMNADALLVRAKTYIGRRPGKRSFESKLNAPFPYKAPPSDPPLYDTLIGRKGANVFGRFAKGASSAMPEAGGIEKSYQELKEQATAAAANTTSWLHNTFFGFDQKSRESIVKLDNYYGKSKNPIKRFTTRAGLYKDIGSRWWNGVGRNADGTMGLSAGRAWARRGAVAGVGLGIMGLNNRRDRR